MSLGNKNISANMSCEENYAGNEEPWGTSVKEMMDCYHGMSLLESQITFIDTPDQLEAFYCRIGQVCFP